MRPSVLLFLLLLVAQARSQAHEASKAEAGDRLLFTVRHFGVSGGLPHRSVTSIDQDARGFLWLGTPQGLARFDGHSFMVLTSADGLSGDAIRGVAADTEGMLWVLYVNGTLEILDPLSLKVTPLAEHLGQLPADAVGAVTSLTTLGDGTVVFTQNRHLFWYHDRAPGLGSYRVDCAGVVDQVRSDVGRQVWCTCHTDPGAEWPVRLSRIDLGPPGVGRPARATLQLPDPIAAVGLRGVDRFERKPTDAPGSYVKVQAGGPLRDCWIPADDTTGASTQRPSLIITEPEARDAFRMQLFPGLWLVDLKIKAMRAGDDPTAAPVVFDLASYFTEEGLVGMHVFRDRLGNVWVGGEYGLLKVSLRKDRFQRFLWNGNGDRVGEHRIRGMLVHGNTLHVNTETTGYWELDAYTGETRNRDAASHFRGGMISDEKNGLWRTRTSEVLHQGSDGTVDRRITTSEGNYDTWTALLLDDGSLLIGTIMGLRIASASTSSSQLVASGDVELDQAWVAHMVKSDQGHTLVCTNAGLFEVDAQGKVLDRWWTGAAKNGPTHFPTDDIRYAHRDTDGTYWLATGSQGLLHWDRAAATLRAFSKQHGIPTASIHAIYPDSRANFWLPTDNGLVRFDPSTGHVKVFTTTDGISFNEFNRLAHTQGPDGRLYFGGINGITIFHPDHLLQPSEIGTAPLVIKTIKVQRHEDDRSQDLTMDHLQGSTISLRPKDRFITIEFALLSYEDAALLNYAWRISGIDEQWNTQREPYLRFTTLPYGDHVVCIKAQDAEGRWSEEISIPIQVIRPVHLRWYFLLLCALALAGAVYGVVRYRERQLRQVIRMRDRIANDLHDEVGSNLSSIVLFSTAVGKHSEVLPEYANTMLQRMKDNSKRAMESMNDIVWSVNSGHDSMEDLVDRMRAYAEPVCEAAGIELDFELNAGPLTRKIAMEQRKNLYLIFKEAVSNAVRHGRCERIAVSLRLVNGVIELVVDDDGTGIPTEAAPGGSLGGNGLGNMLRRAREIGGSVQVLAGDRKGTRVVFCFTPVAE